MTPGPRGRAFATSVAIGLLAAGCGMGADDESATATKRPRDAAAAGQAAPDPNVVTIEDAQMQELKVVPVRAVRFRVDKSATGRIAFNEDRTTPIFSPYTGRITRLLAVPGDEVRPGTPLFEIDTPDLVQAESDLINAHAGDIKARNQLELARRAAARQQSLYEYQAVSLKDLEQAQSDLRNAESDLRAAEGVHAGARDRLRVFGKSDADIATIEEQRRIDRLTLVRSPITGTITTRKVGPGQYVKPDSPDPLFTIADLTTMWLLANVYETDIPHVQVGQPVEVRVPAYPEEIFRARITYIAASADPTTHRIAVRAEVANQGRKLKPEMFANFRITTNEGLDGAAVPIGAVIRDGETATVWIAAGPKQFRRRTVQLGLEQDGLIQVIAGLRPGEQVVADGAVFLSNAGRTAK
jgi:membrane fusion protein, heavy metal efflux system